MTFPDGRIKDGYFENNHFKGSIKVKDGSDADMITRQSFEEVKSIREVKDLVIKSKGSSSQ